MRAEIEKLIAELRTEWNQDIAWVDGLADRLQAILDADYVANPSQLGCSCPCHEQDPVSKLEAMGYTVWLCANNAFEVGAQVELVAFREGEYTQDTINYLYPLRKDVPPTQAITDAAARLLKRVEDSK